MTWYVYNAQAAVDMESQIIVENHIEDSVQDANAAEPALKNMEQDLGMLPEHLVADSGYGNKGTLKTCQEHEVVPVCATGREGKDEKTRALDAMSYDGVPDRFICPHGQAFEFDRERPKDGKRIYRSLNVVGCGCSQYATRDGRGVISALHGHFAKRELRRIMQEPGHREIYRLRKCTVEPVFGQIQVGMGFRRFFYRGSRNVGSEWNLVCAALNVKKMAALMPKSGVWASLSPQTDACLRSLRQWFCAMALHDTPMLRYV